MLDTAAATGDDFAACVAGMRGGFFNSRTVTPLALVVLSGCTSFVLADWPVKCGRRGSEPQPTKNASDTAKSSNSIFVFLIFFVFQFLNRANRHIKKRAESCRDARDFTPLVK